MQELSSNKPVSISYKGQTANVDKLKMGVTFGGRVYVVGQDAAGKRIDFGTLNDLVKVLNNSGLDIEHRKALHAQIKILEKSLETDIKPRIGTRTPTALGYAIRNFSDNLLFNRQANMRKFEAAVVLSGPKTTTSAAEFNHQKTPVDQLQKGTINPFRIDYEKTIDDVKTKRTADEQFQDILAYIKDFQDKHKDDTPPAILAITYAANTAQAKSIYKGNDKGTTPQIKGSNQAEVFALLTAEIKRNGWDNNVHILPIPTCEYTIFRQRKLAKMEDVVQAMDNIKTHKEMPNCFVLGYQNETSNNPETPLAIGGGKAEKLWKDTPQQKYVNELVNRWMAPKTVA